MCVGRTVQTRETFWRKLQVHTVALMTGQALRGVMGISPCCLWMNRESMLANAHLVNPIRTTSSCVVKLITTRAGMPANSGGPYRH